MDCGGAPIIFGNGAGVDNTGRTTSAGNADGAGGAGGSGGDDKLPTGKFGGVPDTLFVGSNMAIVFQFTKK